MSWENAQEQIDARDLETALTRINEAVGSGPYHRYFHVRGKIYFQNFQYEAALDEIDNGLLLAPQDPKTPRPQDPKTPRPQDPKTPRPQDPLFWRARVLLRLDAFDEAKDALALAMELDANPPELREMGRIESRRARRRVGSTSARGRAGSTNGRSFPTAR